jgi:hypothetical protein
MKQAKTQKDNPILVKFVTNGGNIATIGTFNKLDIQELKKWVKKFPIHWVVT